MTRFASFPSTFGRVLIALTVLSTPAWAQYNTAEMTGVILDQQGGALVGVVVAAHNVSTGLTVQRVSDESGRYFLPFLTAEIGRAHV